MLHKPAPYPPDLTWRLTALRQFVFNHVSLAIGAVMVSQMDTQSATVGEAASLLYYFIWFQCAGNIGMLNFIVVMSLARNGWRLVPDAQARYELVGRFMTLPLDTRWKIAVSSTVNVALLSWTGHQLFIALQSTEWGLKALPQLRPSYLNTLGFLAYGTLISFLFEYFCERETLNANRARIAQKLSAQAQLNLLRSQLDPHLLFNTLSNLYELIDENPTQARAMLLNLIGFLRSTLAGSRATQHPLEQEFKLASDYLSLMKIRMGERLATALDLPDHLRQAMVPAMLLQPLVENAIEHGLQLRREGGTLTVTAEAQAGKLILRVGNTGAGAGDASGQTGMLTHDIADATSPFHATDEEGGGFGLLYVRERLSALYGDAASFDMRQSTHDHITWVTLRLPLTLGQPIEAGMPRETPA